MYTIEFQKRGLPHCHICLWLDPNDKLRTPQQIDNFISAEIPDKDVDPALYQLVTENMMHGPCGVEHPDCPCMVNSKCTKKFPKSFNEDTFIDEHGYAIYKRPDNGRNVTKSGSDLGNGFVVPYNPGLLKQYQAHINVEYCNQFGSIKYLFKYINKGPDRVTAVVDEEEVDEIKDYYDCRYLSACESAWRIFKFDIHHRSPSVERLPFHLPNEQSVLFDPRESIDYVLEKESNNTSKFLQWMELNKVDTEARKLLYVDIPTKYVWKKQEGVWELRKKGTAIGRIHQVPPSWGEMYYLRILLNKIPGVQEWNDFKTFNDILYATHREACYARGLLEDDKEYIDGLLEASRWGMGDYLRSFFVALIMTDTMSRPDLVWSKTWRLLAEDVQARERRKHNDPGILYRYLKLNTDLYVLHVHQPNDIVFLIDLELTDMQKYNICLTYIEHMLLCNNRSLKTIENMPYPDPQYTMEGYNRLVNDEMNYNRPELSELHHKMYRTLTDEQKCIYANILDAVHQDNGGMYFVYGYGGTGKTYLYKTMTACLRSEGKIVLNVASSGIAALLLDGGRTAHSRFAIPINVNEESMCSITGDSDLADLLRKTSLIIWDEAPMVHRHCFEAFDRTMRDICRTNLSEPSEKVFGGNFSIYLCYI